MSPAEGTVTDALAALLRPGLDRGLLSAVAWQVGDAESVLTQGHLGTLERGGDPVEAKSLFDLASLTKPVVALAALSLVERGELSLDDVVGEVVPQLTPGGSGVGIGRATVGSVLAHVSGMPGRVELFRSCADRAAMVEALRTMPLRRPGEWEYSSQGFMVVGLVIEAVTGRRLDEVVAERVLVPAGMRDTTYEPELARCVATEECAWRGRLVRGEVHDENAVVWGGPAGHAGLFGTADDLGRLGRALLSPEEAGLLRSQTLRRMRDAATPTRDRRPLGWWPTTQSTAAGDLMSAETFGHTGFTGTSLFVDPARDRWYVLLSNRVHPTREERGFASLRRRFHNLATGVR